VTCKDGAIVSVFNGNRIARGKVLSPTTDRSASNPKAPDPVPQPDDQAARLTSG